MVKEVNMDDLLFQGTKKKTSKKTSASKEKNKIVKQVTLEGEDKLIYDELCEHFGGISFPALLRMLMKKEYRRLEKEGEL